MSVPSLIQQSILSAQRRVGTHNYFCHELGSVSPSLFLRPPARPLVQLWKAACSHPPPAPVSGTGVMAASPAVGLRELWGHRSFVVGGHSTCVGLSFCAHTSQPDRRWHGQAEWVLFPKVCPRSLSWTLALLSLGFLLCTAYIPPTRVWRGSSLKGFLF